MTSVTLWGNVIRGQDPPIQLHLYRRGRAIPVQDTFTSTEIQGRCVVKIRKVAANNRRRAFEIETASKKMLFPYAKLERRPSPRNPVRTVYVDEEVGREAFTYLLGSGEEGTVHIDHVLEYNEDPDYLRDLLLYKLTLKAQERVKKSPLSRREIIRRLRTSATQFYRLLDQTNYRKSIDQLLALLQVLDCDVDLVVREKAAKTA